MPHEPSHEPDAPIAGAEVARLRDDDQRKKNWKRWGPYLSERQWGTVREDYSESGTAWEFFPHDHARSRVYRWGEDGILGITDRECRLCFSVALWNERDPILKERLFGLSGNEGNHGEDVKECYYFLDSTPTHSYMRGLYKYPQAEYPYERLVHENRNRGKDVGEFELTDTGIFEDHRYFDVTAEYAKATPEDILIRITVANRGPEVATLHLLPSLWFRNTWSWGREGEGYWPRPRLDADGTRIHAEHASLGRRVLAVDAASNGVRPSLLFTENETNVERLWGTPNPHPYCKDAFHDCVVGGKPQAVNPAATGTKAAAHYVLRVPAGEEVEVRLRLFDPAETLTEPFAPEFDRTFTLRRDEANEFYDGLIPAGATAEERTILRQGYAGLLWSKQFYHYIVKDWLEGDPTQPAPPAARLQGRNHDWSNLYNRDIISMPDTWEYPWYAAWDLAFHMIPFARLDPEFAKAQLVLFLREWYMHPSGKLPSYEWAFGDVNPPVHAWAVWRVYKITGPKGKRDKLFLERCFQKLLINFTWWVNRKDVHGKNIFGGGFLGLDNIGLFDRSRALPAGGTLEQADGTAWMAFYCSTMLAMAFELASEDPAYEDLASKFFEHFVAICDAINEIGDVGLWDEMDGFYYDELHVDGTQIPLRIRSLVGIIPLFAVEMLEDEVIDRLPGFSKRLNWFLENRRDLADNITYMERGGEQAHGKGAAGHRLLAIPSRDRLLRVLRYVLDEAEFLSPHGLRALSRFHKEHPYSCNILGEEHRVEYAPAEGTTNLFGGNSNWRGPVWFPLNYLIVESLERYHHFYGDDLQVEFPTGSGHMLNLQQVAAEIGTRLSSIFLPDANGMRPCHGEDGRYALDPHWRELVLFHEYFHGDNGRGLGASHQTGWTALVTRLIEKCILARGQQAPPSPAAESSAVLSTPHRAASS